MLARTSAAPGNFRKNVRAAFDAVRAPCFLIAPIEEDDGAPTSSGRAVQLIQTRKDILAPESQIQAPLT